MSTKTKKARATLVKKTAEHTSTRKLLAADDLIPAVFILLYLIVDFVPPLGAADVMATQWFYLALVDVFSIAYFLASKKTIFTEAIKPLSTSLLTLLYIGLFVLCGASIFVAINKVEALVCYARFAVTLIAFFNLAILLYRRLNLFGLLAQGVSIFLLLQSIDVLSEFFKAYGETDLDQLILGLKGNAGNKNILAASLAIKLPFAFYCIYNFKIWSKIFNAAVVTIAAFAIVILNARAAYISTFLASILYIVLCLLTNKKSKQQLLQKISFVVLPITFGFLLSQLTLKNALALQEKGTAYGTLTERLGSIRATTEGSSYRLLQWNSAIDYIQHHPLKGAGFGNWKLASIPYETTFSNDLLVTYHVHNDFLEFAAETGIAGGLLLLSLFIIAAIYGFKVLRSQKANETAIIAAFSLMALAVYFIDAFFNFPNERPVMQILIALVLALLLNAYLKTRNVVNTNQTTGNKNTRLAFSGISLLVLLPSVWLTHTTYKSMVAQKEINGDVLLATPTKTWDEVNRDLPSVPNLNAFCFTTDAIKAKYLIKEKRYDEALVLLDRGYAANPYLPFTEYLKAQVYVDLNKMDSAKKYADIAFAKRPRSIANLHMRNFISFKLNDTSGLHESFNTFVSYRKDEPYAWNDYLNYLNAFSYDPQKIQIVLDSALKLFPDDKDLLQKKAVVNATSTQSLETATSYAAKGRLAFNKKDYTVALQNFSKAADLDPANYANWENMAICYYTQNNFAAASSYFDKAIQLNTAHDGKSEYFKAFCLISLGNKKEACHYLQLAVNKNYPDAKAQLETNCK